MSFLMLYIGQGCKFDSLTLAQGFERLEGAKVIEPGAECIAEYQFEKGDDVTSIRFKKDQETIVIDGAGVASLSAALHIQSNFPGDIRLIDEAYSFDLVLRGITSVQELEQRIKDAGG